MFKSVKKAISGLFGARVVAKPRRNVIALPVDTAAESEAALVDARRGLLAVLEEILAGKKDAEEEAIDNLLDWLHEGFVQGYYYTPEISDSLESLGLSYPKGWYGDDARWGALAAAIEYFAGCLPVDVATLVHALEVIESGNYRHIAETPQNYAGCSYPVEDDESLGMVIADEKLQPDCDEWDYLSTYFDFEACGRDYRESVHGKFTAYGFFAEF